MMIDHPAIIPTNMHYFWTSINKTRVEVGLSQGGGFFLRNVFGADRIPDILEGRVLAFGMADVLVTESDLIVYLMPEAKDALTASNVDIFDMVMRMIEAYYPVYGWQFLTPHYNSRHKLYVWEGVLSDYTDGVMFAYAQDPDHARKLILENQQMSNIDDLAIEPREVTTPEGFAIWGGS